MIAAVIFLPVVMTTFWHGYGFRLENYVPLLYDKIYYEKYLGDLIGENMIQWGVAGYSAVAMAGVFVLFSRKKKVPGSETWDLGMLNLFLLVPICRACAQWLFLCVQSGGSGSYGMMIAYIFVKAYPELFTLTVRGEEEDLCHDGGVLCASFICAVSSNAEKYGSSDRLGPGCVYSYLLWQYFPSGKIYVRHAFRTFGGQYFAERVLSVFL